MPASHSVMHMGSATKYLQKLGIGVYNSQVLPSPPPPTPNMNLGSHILVFTNFIKQDAVK